MKLSVAIVVLFVTQCPARGYCGRRTSLPSSSSRLFPNPPPGPVYGRVFLPPRPPRMSDRPQYPRRPGGYYRRRTSLPSLTSNLFPNPPPGPIYSRVFLPQPPRMMKFRIQNQKRPGGDSGSPNRPSHPASQKKILLNRGAADFSDWGVFPNRSHPNYPPPCFPMDSRPQCVGYGR